MRNAWRGLVIGVAAAAALAVILFAAAGLSFHEFEGIERGSFLALVVDREIREIPVAEVAASVRFRCAPADGTKPQLDGATMTVADLSRAMSEVRDYLLRLGYGPQEGVSVFVKPQIEVRLEQIGQREMTVTKYSWK